MPKAQIGERRRGGGRARGGPRDGRGGRRWPMTRGEQMAQVAQVEQVEQAGPGRPSPSYVGTASSNVGSAGIGGEHDRAKPFKREWVG